MTTTHLDSDPRLLAAVDFRMTISPTDGVEHDWVWDYAKFTFERTIKIYKDLDDKANDIIKYLGGGTGLFTLAALANLKDENLAVFASAIPSFLASMIALGIASRARQPNPAREPPTVKGAFDYAETYETADRARAMFLGHWHEACEGMHVAIGRKSRLVKFATWAFFSAILLLGVPFVVALFHHPSSVVSR